MVDAPEPFTWGAGGARLTPEDIASRRKVADALALQGSDTSAFPTGTRGAGLWTQGAARLAKGLEAGLINRKADDAAQANADDNKQMIAALLGGGTSQAAAPAAPVAAAPAPQAAVAPSGPVAEGPTAIHSPDEPNPLDQPTGVDRDHMIRTIYGEAGNEPTQGQLAVAAVIRNRAVDGGYGGHSVSDVVHAPNQFEPWSRPDAKARMLALDPNSPQYQAISKVVDAAYGAGGKAPEDPTEGKTMFYSPGAQAALGRPAPSWAKGEGQVIGGHTFFDDSEDAPAAKPEMAFAAPATPSPGVAAVTAAAGGTPAPQAAPTPGTARVQAAMSALTSPYVDAGTKQMAAQILAQETKPKASAPYKDADGNLLQMGPDGTLHAVIQAEKSPTSVKEYEYYKEHPTPGQPVMDYGTWATAKARDAATESPGQVKSLTPGGELYHLENGKVVIDHKNDKNVNVEDVPQTTIDFLADRVRMGDPGVKTGYARNPGMIAKIDSTAQQREDAGIPVSDAAKNVTQNKVTLSARGSAERKLGTINTNNEFYGNNALGALDIAEKASADVPRTDYPSVNKALNAYRTQTGDPKTVALGAALNTVVNDYAKFTGGGVGTDSLRGHAEEILNGAHSPEQLAAIVHMMRLEIKRGQQSPSMVREGFDNLYAPHGSAVTPAAASPSPDGSVVVDGYTIKAR